MFKSSCSRCLANGTLPFKRGESAGMVSFLIGQFLRELHYSLCFLPVPQGVGTALNEPVRFPTWKISDLHNVLMHSWGSSNGESDGVFSFLVALLPEERRLPSPLPSVPSYDVKIRYFLCLKNASYSPNDEEAAGVFTFLIGRRLSEDYLCPSLKFPPSCTCRSLNFRISDV